MIQLKNKNWKPNIENIFKTDVFCLGCILIEVSTLNSIDEAFDYENFSINYKILIEKLRNSNYSLQFQEFIISMLEKDLNKRPDFIKLNEKITEYLKNNIEYKTETILTESFFKKTEENNNQILKEKLIFDINESIININQSALIYKKKEEFNNNLIHFKNERNNHSGKENNKISENFSDFKEVEEISNKENENFKYFIFFFI